MAISNDGKVVAIRRNNENNLVLWDDSINPPIEIITLSSLDINDIEVLKTILDPKLLLSN